MPHASTSTGMPPSDVTVSTSSSVSVSLQASRAARSRSRCRSTSRRAQPRARRACGCCRCASSSCCGSMARPHGCSTRTTSAPHAARNLAHAFAEHAVDADDHGVAGLDEVDEARFHPRGTGAADRQGQRVVRAEDGTEPVGDLVEHVEEVGVEVPEDGTLECFHHLGIRIRRPRPEQQPFSMHEARLVACDRTTPRRDGVFLSPSLRPGIPAL